ncbi:MAG TPA: lysozyme inhibitor LprI family protein [Caulobacteraceae bacterium]|nr:lysozyme inhibitor LprI family protein [Caulobacteraceae bacterium]
MVKRAIVFAAAATVIVAMGASAAWAAPASVEAYYSRTYKTCMDGAVSTMETRDCVNAEHDDWDKALNQIYQTLMASRSPAEKIELRDDERVWLKREKATCDHAGDDEQGGSLQLVEIDMCYMDETIRRAVYLRGLH